MFIFWTLNINNYVVVVQLQLPEMIRLETFPLYYSLSNYSLYYVVFPLFYVKYIFYFLCLCLYEWQNGFKLKLQQENEWIGMWRKHAT
jgi:hypothetical protein